MQTALERHVVHELGIARITNTQEIPVFSDTETEAGTNNTGWSTSNGVRSRPRCSGADDFTGSTQNAGARVAAEDPRVRQRVAGQRLHQRHGQAPRGDGQPPGEGSRQSGIKDDAAIGALAGAGAGITYDDKRQGFGADQQAERNWYD